MRVLYWNPLWWPHIGGMELAGVLLLRALRARGHETRVATSHDTLDLPDVGEHDGTPVHRFPFRRALAERDPRLMLAAQKGIGALKREFRPDVVHVNLPDPGALAHLRTLGAERPRLVVTIHADIPLGPSGETVFGALLGAADRVVTPSAAILAPLVRAMPALAEKASVVHYGLERTPAPPPPPATPRIVVCGRMIPEKGFDVAVEAFASLASRFPDARLVLAGDGPERARLEAMAAARGIASRVDFLGWVLPERMPELLASSSTVVIPSRWQDAFPTVALQTAHAGRPAIASRVGGLPESVLDERTGLIVDAGDVAALARALERLLAAPDEAARLGRAARERALRDFSLERYADDYERLYEAAGAEAIGA